MATLMLKATQHRAIVSELNLNKASISLKLRPILMYPVDFINQVQADSLIQRAGENLGIQKISRGNLYFMFFMDD
jgi:hypothetical protein